jgi:hypothetical protein
MWTLTSLMEHGTFEKFPDLDFVFLEGGIGWIPFMIARLNREVAEFRHEVPVLEKQAEEYIKDQCYFGTQPVGEFMNDQHMVHMLQSIGAESLMYTTDYPTTTLITPTRSTNCSGRPSTQTVARRFSTATLLMSTTSTRRREKIIYTPHTRFTTWRTHRCISR